MTNNKQLLKQFLETIYVRIEPDSGVDILVAGADVHDALGPIDHAVLGIYRLEKIVEAHRSVEVRDVAVDADDVGIYAQRRMNKKRPATKGNT